MFNYIINYPIIDKTSHRKSIIYEYLKIIYKIFKNPLIEVNNYTIEFRLKLKSRRTSDEN